SLVRVHVENLGADSVRVDSLTLHFTRSSPGDADADFQVAVRPGNALGIAGSSQAWLSLNVNVLERAITGPVTVDAAASVTEILTGARFSDGGADTVLASAVTVGGFDLSATQSSGAAFPGSTGVPLLALTLTSRYPDTRSLHGLLLANRTSGAGTQDQLGAELGEVTLYRDDGDGVLNPAVDVPLLSTVALDGSINFTPLATPVAPGAPVTFFVAANLPLEMRDGDALDLAIASAGSISFAPPSFTRNLWPVDPPGFRTVNGMVADQVDAAPVGPGSLRAGSIRQLAMDVTVPSNGYEEDQLVRLSVVNEGTADPSEIAQVEGWVDDGNGLFDPASDRLLGSLFFTGDRWQRTGLAEHVPLGGLRLFVSVDVSDVAAEGNTVKLALPAAPDEGVGMQSGDSGPLDRRVSNSSALTISTADRILVSSGAIAPGVVPPGARSVPLLDLVLTNRYAVAESLAELWITNRTVGPGNAAERDAEAQSIALRVDGNANGLLDGTSVDPVIGVGIFTGGRALFSGMRLPLAPAESKRLFVTADVSRSAATDGDVLALEIADPSDLRFGQPLTLGASWPIASGAAATIDGLVADQVTSMDFPASSLGPGEGPALAFDAWIPADGYRDDELNELRVVNRGTAGAGDIGALRLWVDGGDGLFSSGSGDDVDLGPLTRAGSEWVSGPLAVPLHGTGACFFVGLTAALSPADSSTVALAIPLGGIE
ncbi:MAG TPA: hypothetical protein VFD83_01960, partial [Candidatus Polarisedimenticolia bacterium]|nr:hypothetical protein [Candidatus Polarisedimenticolia bacterium]